MGGGREGGKSEKGGEREGRREGREEEGGLSTYDTRVMDFAADLIGWVGLVEERERMDIEQ